MHLPSARWRNVTPRPTQVEIGLAHEVLYKLITCPELPGGGCRRFHIPTYVSTVRHLPPGKLPAGPEKQSREQLDAVEAAYAALDAASRGDDALAAEIVSMGVFEASQRRRAALLARNVTNKEWDSEGFWQVSEGF